MITTGIHIPEAVLKKLGSAVAALHRATANMTMADLRKAYRERSGATLGCFVSVEFTKTGAVKGFRAQQINKSQEKFRESGFETDVPMLGPSRYDARSLAGDFGEFLLRHEITRRRNANQRELVGLTDDQLSAAADELLPMESWLAVKSTSCGSLSERLRLRLIKDEIAVRSTESNHRRLKAMAENADYLAACNKIVKTQLAAAWEWRKMKEASPYYSFYVGRDFENRADADQTLIAYRDAQGWQV